MGRWRAARAVASCLVLLAGGCGDGAAVDRPDGSAGGSGGRGGSAARGAGTGASDALDAGDAGSPLDASSAAAGQGAVDAAIGDDTCQPRRTGELEPLDGSEHALAGLGRSMTPNAELLSEFSAQVEGETYGFEVAETGYLTKRAADANGTFAFALTNTTSTALCRPSLQASHPLPGGGVASGTATIIGATAVRRSGVYDSACAFPGRTVFATFGTGQAPDLAAGPVTLAFVEPPAPAATPGAAMRATAAALGEQGELLIDFENTGVTAGRISTSASFYVLLDASQRPLYFDTFQPASTLEDELRGPFEPGQGDRLTAERYDASPFNGSASSVRVYLATRDAELLCDDGYGRLRQAPPPRIRYADGGGQALPCVRGLALVQVELRSVGLARLCVVTDVGEAVCWGTLTYAIPDDTRFAAISARRDCGLTRDGQLRCWGEDDRYEYLARGRRFSAIGFANQGGCGLDTAGALQCWGGASEFQAAPAGAFTQLAVGTHHACALRQDGAAVCWGSELGGALEVPAQAFTAIASGEGASCGLTADGRALCWGVAASPAADERFVALDVGNTGYACGIRSDGSLYCWTSAGVAPEPCLGDDLHCVDLRPPAGAFVQLSVSSQAACAIDSDARLQCWGAAYDRVPEPLAGCL